MGAEGCARADFDSKVKAISVGRLWLTLFCARYFDRPLPSYGNIVGINEVAPPNYSGHRIENFFSQAKDVLVGKYSNFGNFLEFMPLTCCRLRHISAVSAAHFDGNGGGCSTRTVQVLPDMQLNAAIQHT